MKRVILNLIVVLPLLSACGRMNDTTVQADDGTVNPELVAMNDGTLMRVSCIRANATAIQSQGPDAAQSCIVGNARQAVDQNGRGFGSTYPSWWFSYYIYPPYYYGSGTSSPGAGNQNSLCSYLGFGSSYNAGFNYGVTGFNCYSDLLGYNHDYSSSYNSRCDKCLYKANAGNCYNRCLYKSGWHW